MDRPRPNDLGAFWLPFTPNRDFKTNPRMLARAEGMYFYDEDGRALLDACSGLWCSNLGHGRKEIADAISKAAHELDFRTNLIQPHHDLPRLISTKQEQDGKPL